MTEELKYIDKQIRSAEISLYRAEQKPNCNEEEIANIKHKLLLLNNIREVLYEVHNNT